MNTPLVIRKAAEWHALKRSWFGEGGNAVPNEQAQQRADVCLKCENNQEKPLYEIFASVEAKSVIRQLKAKGQMDIRVRGEECLHICSVCLCVLKLKVHTPLKYILESSNLEGLPDFCWQITEQKTQNSNDNKSDGLPK